MRLSSQVGIGSKEQDFAGSVDSSLMISCTDVGSNSVSGSTFLGMMTGAAAAAVDARILSVCLSVCVYVVLYLLFVSVCLWLTY